MASAPFQQGEGHARSEITHAQDPTKLRAAAGGRRGRAVGVGWPLPEELSDAALEARLFPASMALAAIKSRRTQADWPAIHRELKRPGVTLQLVWEEHRTAHPEGYGYSRFCELFRTWAGRLAPPTKAADPSCRREVVRRLCRHDAGRDRRIPSVSPSANMPGFEGIL